MRPFLFRLVALLVGAAVLGTASAHAEQRKKHKRAKHAAVAAARAQKAAGHYGSNKFPAGPLYYNGGEYLGDDPDPNIRFQLWRDLGSRFGGEP